MTDKRMTRSFKSYVGFDDDLLNTSTEESFTESLAPKLLNGERLIAETPNVLMFSPIKETSVSQKNPSMLFSSQGMSGVLCCTNFKLSFITADDKSKELKENDICLTNIDSIYIQSSNKERKKRLTPGTSLFSEKVKGLFIVCKNTRTVSFSFKFSPIGSGKTMVNTLLHHAFPTRHELLFAYDYREPRLDPYSSKSETFLFRDIESYINEINRTGCKNWKISTANADFQMSPRWLVVPTKLLDYQLADAARHFRAGRPPLWSWSSPHGATLVRMAEIVPTISERYVYHRAHLQFYTPPNVFTRSQENIMLEFVRGTHPHNKAPIVLDLTINVPSVKDVLCSYMKLKELCTPEDSKQFWIQDQHYFSLLENTHWLTYVSQCLKISLRAAMELYNDISVVLQEGDGRDMCCLISSLTQILIDPYYRTIHGFQSLIQKEWIAMGHPFCSRLGHIHPPELFSESPLFLLFLDCVWQLLQQCQLDFQFTETYLTLIWEATHVSIFDTFLFDCEKDRVSASEVRRTQGKDTTLILRSLWEEILNGELSCLFFNPNFMPQNKQIDLLRISCGIPCLKIWQQCYYRHVGILEIKGGGNPQIDLVSRLLAQEDFGLDSIQIDSLNKVGSFFPFTSSTSNSTNCAPPALLISSLSLNASFHSTEIMLDSQSILNGPD